MKNPFASRNVSEPVRRRVELAVAVAQERLLTTHVDYALNLIEIVGGRVAFDDVLGIYVRLLRLSDDEARVITTRTLATLGERTDEEEEIPATAGLEGAGESEDTGRSFFSNIRQRFRGRVNDELRRKVELAAARTEVAVLETHVENALNFVDILDGELPFDESVELYVDALDVRDALAEVVYHISLARLSEDLLSTPAPTRRERRPEEKEAEIRVSQGERG